MASSLRLYRFIIWLGLAAAITTTGGIPWSSRYKWLEQRAPKQQEAAVTVVTKPGDVLLATHKELEERTKSALARATTRAAEAAANAADPLPVTSTAQLRDLAASAARAFGWDSQGTTVHADKALVVTTAQLQLMRSLCETPDERERNRNTERQPLPAPPVPTYEVKVTA